jgi:hypothetical protein
VKLLIAEGSPEELARLDALTGFFREASQRLGNARHDGTHRDDDWSEGMAVIPEHVRAFIAKWATNPLKRELVEQFVARVLELGNAEVELGKSNKSHDGLNKYLMLRYVGVRRKGAAVYVTPHLGRARFRLPPEEAERWEHAQTLQRREPYQVAVYLTSPAAVDEAVELAKEALDATAA